MRTTEWCRACVSLGIVGAVLAMPDITRAEEPRYRVELHAPKYLPNCNDLEDFLVELDLVLNHSLLGSPETRVLDVRIERPSGGSYVVDIVIKHVDGQVLSKQSQTYSGAMECFKVLHKVAFIAAMEMEKDVPAEPEKDPDSWPSQPTPKPACPPCPASPPRCPEPVAAKPKSAPRKRGFVGLGVAAFLNVAPEAFFAPHVRAGWYVRPRVMLEVDVAGQAWMTTKPQDGLTNIAVRTGIATLAGCYAPRTFLFCGLFAAELRHTSSSEQIPEIRLLPTTGLRAGYDHLLNRSLLLRTNLDLFVYLRDREIDARASTFWEPIPLATNLTTSLVWTF